MPDQDDSDDHKAKGDHAAPAGLPHSQIAAPGSQHPQPPHHEERATEDDKPPTYKALWKEIRIIDVINSVVGVAMLFVAFAAYRVASDSSDIKNAVRNISALASQTKRQADELHNQFGQIKREADASESQIGVLKDQLSQMKLQTGAFQSQATAAQGQLGEARKQTKAIAAQTNAIKRSATAEVKSAQAQQQSAVATMEAHKPAVALYDIQIAGLNSPLDKDGRVPFTLKVRFRNIGGSTILAPDITECLLLDDKLPALPVYKGACITAGGNDLSATQGIDFGQADPSPFQTAKQIAADINSGKLNAFVYGTLGYQDVGGKSHKFCFAYRVAIKDGSGGIAYPAGEAAYHCDT